MTAVMERSINFGLLVDDITERFECQCGTVYRLYPRAIGLGWPRGYAAPVLGDGGAERFAGTLVALVPEADDGVQHYRRVRWSCACGTICSYVVPTRDRVDCWSCAKAEMERDPLKRPSDYYLNPRWGMACDCCGHQGTHLVRRDGVARPRCMQ